MVNAMGAARRVAKRLRELKVGLGLQNWDLVIDSVPYAALPDGTLGRTEPDRRTMTATIVVAADRPDAEVEWTCVHEALHLLHNDLAAVLDHALERLGPQARDVILDQWQDVEERTVIALTRWATGRSADGS